MGVRLMRSPTRTHANLLAGLLEQPAWPDRTSPTPPHAPTEVAASGPLLWYAVEEAEDAQREATLARAADFGRALVPFQIAVAVAAGALVLRACLPTLIALVAQ